MTAQATTETTRKAEALLVVTARPESAVERPLQVDVTVATAQRRPNGEEAQTALGLCAMPVDYTTQN